ncbi:hypothetical protein ACFQRK_04125 [Parapedobacter sp. GCM10030251]|uniref:hypothetical protein n=1 Tax=Parapedobacter sp. GCM10030251 TaxID=3273419 RepID=UPI003618906E
MPGVYSDAVTKNQKVLYGVWGARIPREAGRLLTISELAELKDFKLKYRTDNTKDEKFFTSTYSISFQADAKVQDIWDTSWAFYSVGFIAIISLLIGLVLLAMKK